MCQFITKLYRPRTAQPLETEPSQTQLIHRYISARPTAPPRSHQLRAAPLRRNWCARQNFLISLQDHMFPPRFVPYQ